MQQGQRGEHKQQRQQYLKKSTLTQQLLNVFEENKDMKEFLQHHAAMWLANPRGRTVTDSASCLSRACTGGS